MSSEGVGGTAQSVPATGDSHQGTAQAHCHLPAVLPALHQRARGSRLGGLPRVPGADGAAGLPDSPRATERDLLPAREAGQLPPAAEVLPHAGGRPWGRTAAGQGCPGGGRGGRRHIFSEPGGQQVASGHKTVPLSSPCPSWTSAHRLRDSGSGRSLAKLALLVPTGGWGLWFGGAADGSAAQDREGGGAQTQHSPRTSFPPPVLAAPGSVCPPLPASAPLPLVRQAAAPAPCGSQVR